MLAKRRVVLLPITVWIFLKLKKKWIICGLNSNFISRKKLFITISNIVQIRCAKFSKIVKKFGKSRKKPRKKKMFTPRTIVFRDYTIIYLSDASFCRIKISFKIVHFKRISLCGESVFFCHNSSTSNRRCFFGCIELLALSSDKSK